MYKTIMVPLDGFATAEDALDTAARLAACCNAQLHIVHVVDPAVRPLYGLSVPGSEWWNGGALKHGEEYLRRMVEQVTEEHDLRVTHAMLEPPVAAAIMQEAERVDASLLVMSTHGHTPAGRIWLGSVADQIAREYTGPVLFQRSNETTEFLPVARPFKKILIPLDGSRLAEQIIPHARELAAVDKAALIMFHVARPHWSPVPVLPFVYAGEAEPTNASEPEFEAAAREYLDDVAQQEARSDLRPFTDVRVTGVPAAVAILDYAEREKIDAIALTTHGHGGVRRLLLGSVADKIVRSANCAVLLLRPQPNSAHV